MLLKFLLGSVVLVASVSLASLLWPKFTTKSKPAILEEVQKNIMLTPVGKELANMLGVSQTTPGAPINLQQVAASAATTVVETVEKRTTEVITVQAIKQLTQQFEKLPDEQKTQIRENICKP